MDEPATALEAAPLVRTKFPPGPLSMRTLFGATLLVLVVVGLVKPDDQAIGHARSDAAQIAKLTTLKYALEAFPQWAIQHPEAACPTRWSDLDPFMATWGHRDPWGHDYVFMCARGNLYVMSLGPDGRSNTADDLWSHE